MAGPEIQTLEAKGSRILIRRWAAFASLAAVSLVPGWLLLRRLWTPVNAARWALLAGLALTYLLIFLARHLKRNRRVDDGSLLTRFGLGTNLTLLRGTMIAWTAGFLLTPRPTGTLAWAPVVLYTTALILDLFDGYAARVRDHQTQLGEKLDVELDAFGLLVAISLAVWYGTLPTLFLLIGFSRYAYILGIELRKRRNQPVFELPASDTRRPIAGLTMGFTSAMLWPIVIPPGSTIAGWIFLLPFSASFLRDWSVVSGWLDPSSAGYLRARATSKAVLLRWFPLLLRLFIAGWAAITLLALTFRWFTSLPALPAIPPAALLWLGLGMIVLGIAGRWVAFILIFPLGFEIVAIGLNPELAILLAAVLAILILGTGAFSLWEPERRVFGGRWGEG